MKRRFDFDLERMADLADEMAEGFDLLFTAAAKVLLPLIVGLFLGYAWRMLQGF